MQNDDLQSINNILIAIDAYKIVVIKYYYGLRYLAINIELINIISRFSTGVACNIKE